ncbi:uracil-DNA glycosylase [Geomonas paludis]|uniref:Uracil-DNA glycosylase n=1 Tax=Geomonas paludis TaxID=2740185 RepID=A0A6V8MUU0_9BACT|nr:uracil-DNA glycosylase family protein [Geomonas paludis]UPU37683.1 uracil-DNA glycosylase [Geomonas paludis]GFO63781.1 hypothetical protein GMPD_17000 [Geomonas paludis]
MAEMENRELLLRSLKGYLVDLAESGVDELAYGTGAVTPSAVAGSAASAPAAAPAAAATPAPVQPQAAIPDEAAALAESAVAAPLAPAAAPAVKGLDATCRQEGNPQARLLFLMAGPGYAGAAGDLLAKIIGAMKFKTDQVCLLSFDAGGESAAMAESVARRIETVAPEVVVTLGEEATGLMLGGKTSLEQVRGQWQEVRGRGVMPTLHPELLLADEGLKRHVWEDMKLVMRRLAGAG